MFHIEAGNALASAFLFAESIDRHTFDVVIFGDRDNDRLFGDDVFHLELTFSGDDLSSALAFMMFTKLFELVFDDTANEYFAGKNGSVVSDSLLQLFIFIFDLTRAQDQ